MPRRKAEKSNPHSEVLLAAIAKRERKAAKRARDYETYLRTYPGAAKLPGYVKPRAKKPRRKAGV